MALITSADTGRLSPLILEARISAASGVVVRP